MRKQYCIHCNPYGLKSGVIFHPIGALSQCQNCKRMVPKGLLIVAFEFEYNQEPVRTRNQ